MIRADEWVCFVVLTLMSNVLMEITCNAHRVGVRSAPCAVFMHFSVVSIKHKFEHKC